MSIGREKKYIESKKLALHFIFIIGRGDTFFLKNATFRKTDFFLKMKKKNLEF